MRRTSADENGGVQLTTKAVEELILRMTQVETQVRDCVNVPGEEFAVGLERDEITMIRSALFMALPAIRLSEAVRTGNSKAAHDAAIEQAHMVYVASLPVELL